MKIFIMRHGQAQSIAPSDFSRSLTEQGINEAVKAGQRLSNHHDVINCVFVSPYLRAQQTADVVIEQLNDKLTRKTLSFITPEDNARDVHDYLDAVCSVEKYDSILLVSHMPLVSYLVAELTYDNTMPIFQTATIAKIEYNTEQMQGELIALFSSN